jgi:hypothetical protein
MHGDLKAVEQAAKYLEQQLSGFDLHACDVRQRGGEDREGGRRSRLSLSLEQIVSLSI